MLINPSEIKEELNDWNPVGGISALIRLFNRVVHIVPNMPYFECDLILTSN